MDLSSAAVADELLLQIWKLWEGVGVAYGVQSLDELKDNTGETFREGPRSDCPETCSFHFP